jgi:DNA ligase-1
LLLCDLVQTSARVASTSARLEKIELLAGLLVRLEGEDAPIGVAYLCGELVQGRIGLGYAAVRAALSVPPSSEEALTLRDVDAAFARVAACSGRGSADARLGELKGLFARASEREREFLARLILGELRQGALEAVLLEAVARSRNLPSDALRRAAMLAGDLRAVASAVLGQGEEGLSRFRLRLFSPLQPMLAQPCESPTAAIEKLGRASLEWKLDGARIQVHRLLDEVRIFSRAGNDVTVALPEIVETALRLPARELVLDGEAIALGPADLGARPLPFQVTMRRFGRRLDVEPARAELPLTPFFFDLLHLDGSDCIDLPTQERWRMLEGLVPPSHRVARRIAEDAESAEAFYAASLEQGHEGVLAKALDAPYEAGRRGGRWLKIKPAHTLDLVVLAAEWGSGRRSGWLSNLHLGARDPATGGFAMLGKTFKGMTDEVLAWQTQKLLELETHRSGQVVFVKPELVAEFAFDGVQASPHYESGLALRFARLRRYRPDKTPLEADTIETVRRFSGLE